VRHRLFICISILSLFLCATTLVSWAASTHREDTVGWAGWKDKSAGIWQGWGVKVEGGKLVAYWFAGNWKFDDPSNVGPSDAKMQPHFIHESHQVAGHGYFPQKAFEWKAYYAVGSGTHIDFRFIGLPLWLPALLFAIPIAWAIFLVVRRRIASRHGFDVLPRPTY